MDKYIIDQAHTEKVLLRYIDEQRPQSFANLYTQYLYLCKKINIKPLDKILEYYKLEKCERFGFER